MKALLIAAGAMLLPAAVHAEICYSDTRDATVAVPATSTTAFNCPTAGRKTVQQLAAMGLRLVKLSPLIVGGSGLSFQAADQLIIEMSEEIFAHGFE